jgi:hypothetical protein
MFPFERPTNYGEMLNKIGMFTFVIVLGLTLLVSHYSSLVKSFLNTFQVPVEIWSLHIPVLYVVPALLLATLARIVRLHDQVSDIFRIRERFDIYRLLIPLCGAVGVAVDLAFRDKLRNRRQQAMARTFYRYASFEEPVISKAIVLGAIDVWTWYWILLEGIVMLIIASMVLLAVGAYAQSGAIIGLSFLATLLFCTHYDNCGKRADAQIEELIADDQRVIAIRNEFNAIRQQA